MQDLIGRTMGSYRIVEQLGRGGMATVYKAYHPVLDRYVAVKVLPRYFTHDTTFFGNRSDGLRLKLSILDLGTVSGTKGGLPTPRNCGIIGA